MWSYSIRLFACLHPHTSVYILFISGSEKSVLVCKNTNGCSEGPMYVTRCLFKAHRFHGTEKQFQQQYNIVITLKIKKVQRVSLDYANNVETNQTESLYKILNNIPFEVF